MKKMFIYALPFMFIGMIDLLLIVVDIIWVSVLLKDADAVASIRISGSIITIIEAILMAVISSFLIYMSQHYAAKKSKEVLQSFRTALLFSIYLGICIMLIGLPLSSLLGKLFLINDTTSLYIDEYLFYYILGYVFLSVNNFLLLVPRYFNQLKIIYKALALIFLVNAIVTPIAMLTFDAYQLSMVSGAAVGTVLANIACFVYLGKKLILDDVLDIGITFKGISFKPNFTIVKSIKGYLSTQIVSAITFNLSSFLILIILAYYPQTIFNVYTMSMYIYAFAGIVIQQFATGLIPYVSKHVGLGDYYAISSMVQKMCLAIAGYGLTASTIIIVNADRIAQVINIENVSQQLVTDFLTFYTIPWAMSLMSILFIFVAAGVGDSKGSMYLTIMNMYLLTIGSLLVIPPLFPNVEYGVIIALSVTPILTFTNSLGYFLSGRWKKQSLLQEKIDKQAG